MFNRLPQKLQRYGALVLLAGAAAGCHSTSVPAPTEPIIEPQPQPEAKLRSSKPTPVPRMGVVTEKIAGQQRLFSTFGFWMVGEPLKSQLLGSFRPDGTLDREKLQATFPAATIVEGKKVVAVALSSGTFTFFLLQDGPLISLDPKFDAMVQQMSVRAYTTP
jgi:hypothetical protein